MAKETFRSYCPACSNYKALRRFADGEYFCGTCTGKINRRLRELRIDPHIRSPDELLTVNMVLDQIIEGIQRETESEKKSTKADYEQKWRTGKRKKRRPS